MLSRFTYSSPQRSSALRGALVVAVFALLPAGGGLADDAARAAESQRDVQRCGVIIEPASQPTQVAPCVYAVRKALVLSEIDSAQYGDAEDATVTR